MITLIEMSLSAGEPTGLEMVIESMDAALYTARLKNGKAQMGATGRVVYPLGVCGDLAWVQKKEKEA